MARGKSRTSFGCDHRGFGAFCHRCKQAEGLKVLAESYKDGEDKKWLLKESARLFAPVARKTRALDPVIG